MSADLVATLARVKVGDEVTATFHELVVGGSYFVSQGAGVWSIRGTVYAHDGDLRVGSRTVRFSDGVLRPWLIDLVINKPAPDPEPPIGSVVLDKIGDAWQRTVGDQSGGSWWASCLAWPYPNEITWDRLSEAAGPLRVIYTPEVES